jgi:hypothetical protein
MLYEDAHTSVDAVDERAEVAPTAIRLLHLFYEHLSLAVLFLSRRYRFWGVKRVILHLRPSGQQLLDVVRQRGPSG